MIAAVPGLVVTIPEVNQFYSPQDTWTWFYATAGVVKGTFSKAIAFGTIGTRSFE